MAGRGVLRPRATSARSASRSVPVNIVGDYGPRRISAACRPAWDLFPSPDLWQCTTCMNCLRVCPKEVDMIQDHARRAQEAVLKGNVPAELQEVFENTLTTATRWASRRRSAHAWTKKSAVDVPLDEGQEEGRLPVVRRVLPELPPARHRRERRAGARVRPARRSTTASSAPRRSAPATASAWPASRASSRSAPSTTSRCSSATRCAR